MYKNIREEELKNKVGKDWFSKFDHTEILGNIDFTIFPQQTGLLEQTDMFGRNPLLWAEAKTGNYDVVTMFVQLILTIGKARTYDKTMPPAFLWAFDFQKIAFVPYISVEDIFVMNDFNWNVTPSNHSTKEFQLIKTRIEETLKTHSYVFDYEKDESQLKKFIAQNIAKSTTSAKIKINKNNFVPLYLRWIKDIKPIIDINWEHAAKKWIYDHDFYLADLFVDDKNTQNIDDDLSTIESLYVIYQSQGYTIKKENFDSLGDQFFSIKDKNTYQNFWKLYKRPPHKDYHDYIIERKDLLVAQDIRERKGAYFTPRMWVELSQKYIGDVFGENWQDEYYIWDCAAGTGNLLAGLTNKYNIFASTLDQADVNVMHERIDHGANLLKDHVFQFDFLNDDFTKRPQALQDIIADPEKRKKLIMYINPPYAEATSANTVTGTGNNKKWVSTNFAVNEYFNPKIGNATNEMFALFMAQIYQKIHGCMLWQFSKLKIVNGSNFRKFKNFFLAKYEKWFIVPWDTFDNVKWDFPIGFTIWDTGVKEKIDEVSTDIFDRKWDFLGTKNFYGNLGESINKWIKLFDEKEKKGIGFMENPAPDYQNNKFLNFSRNIGTRHVNYYSFQAENLIPWCVYFSVRLCLDATWLNDRDQFLFPNDGWKTDREFQNDCLAFTLFHGQNRITSKDWVNHWIPFTESEVNAQARFESNWMTDFIAGRIKTEEKDENTLFESEKTENYVPWEKLIFSDEANAVFEAGWELWRYYHAQHGVNANASLYDIKEYFQGRNDKGRMNARSDDTRYMELIGNLRNTIGILAEKITPKVYEYGFLKI
jgi:hypothetical protein